MSAAVTSLSAACTDPRCALNSARPLGPAQTPPRTARWPASPSPRLDAPSRPAPLAFGSALPLRPCPPSAVPSHASTRSARQPRLRNRGVMQTPSLGAARAPLPRWHPRRFCRCRRRLHARSGPGVGIRGPCSRPGTPPARAPHTRQPHASRDKRRNIANAG
eukprot:533683-Rhodomonas_salina.1